MRTLAKWLGGLASVAIVLFGAWYLIASQGWLPRLSDEQKAAIALMEQPLPSSDGDNALVTLELIHYDVPDADWAKWQAYGSSGLQKALDAAGYHRLLKSADIPNCGSDSRACLEEVLDDPLAAREKQTRAAEVIARLPKLYRATYASARQSSQKLDWLEPPAAFTTPGHLGGLDAALDFADGDVESAVGKVCRQATFWRGLISHSDMLIAQLVAARYTIRAGEMLNGMVMREPLRATPSADCLEAFVSLSAGERSLCNAMRGEHAFFTAIEFENDADQPLLGPGINKAHANALFASANARLCDDDYVQAIRSDNQEAIKPLTCSWTEKLFDPAGCSLFQMGQAAYSDYIHRVDDYSANLSAIRSALAINSRTSGVTLMSAFQQRPDGDLREQQRMDTQDDSFAVLTLAAGSFHHSYRFKPLPLRADESVEVPAE